MPVTLKKSGTVSVTGGQDQILTKTAQSVLSGVQLADFSQADFRLRENLTIKGKLPSLQSDGNYSKGKFVAAISVPFILSNGKTVFNIGRLEMEIHPELPAASAMELRQRTAQLATNSSLTNFWLGGDTDL